MRYIHLTRSVAQVEIELNSTQHRNVFDWTPAILHTCLTEAMSTTVIDTMSLVYRKMKQNFYFIFFDGCKTVQKRTAYHFKGTKFCGFHSLRGLPRNAKIRSFAKFLFLVDRESF